MRLARLARKIASHDTTTGLDIASIDEEDFNHFYIHRQWKLLLRNQGMSLSRHGILQGAVISKSNRRYSSVDTKKTEKSANRAVNAIPVSGVCCICTNSGKFRCSNCKLQLYCSKTCQLIDWRMHQTQCNRKQLELLSNSLDFNLYDQCLKCEKGVLSRIYGWELMCQSCFSARHQSYFNPENQLEYSKVSSLARYAKCQKVCVKCRSSSFVILRDEMQDEWLVCVACEKTKQLVRCWNAFLNCYVKCIERPLRFNAEEEEDDAEMSYTEEEVFSDGDEEDAQDMTVSMHSERIMSSRGSRGRLEIASVEEDPVAALQGVKELAGDLHFEFIGNKTKKDALELSVADLRHETPDMIRGGLQACGVKEQVLASLKKEEMIYVYSSIAAGVKDIALLEQLTLPSSTAPAGFGNMALQIISPGEEDDV